MLAKRWGTGFRRGREESSRGEGTEEEPGGQQGGSLGSWRLAAENQQEGLHPLQSVERQVQVPMPWAPGLLTAHLVVFGQCLEVPFPKLFL